MSDADRGPVVTDEEIAAVLTNREEDWLRAREVADDLPISTEEAIDRLDDLYERDLVERREDPAEAWRLAPGAEEELSVREAAVETEVEAQASKVAGAESSPREEETPESPPPDPGTDPLGPVHDFPEDTIEAFEPPGTPEEQELRRDALRQVYAYVRERGPVDRATLEADVYPSAPAGYDSSEAWWEETVGRGLEAMPGVTRSEGGRWHVTADRDEPAER